MGLIASLIRFGRRINGTKTLYDFYLEHNQRIPEGIVIKDSHGREYITGKLEVVCKEEVGIQIHSVGDQWNTEFIPLLPTDLKKYFVLPGN